MTAADYRDPNNFRTVFDRKDYGNEQYQKGLELGADCSGIFIAMNNCWSARRKDGAHITAYEKLGYHANTADLLRGFLDSGCAVSVFLGNSWVEVQ